MTQYLVITDKGKIVLSEPSLPISDTDLQFINTEWLGTLYEGLQTKIPNLIHCEVMQIDWNKDIVHHLVIQA